MNKKLITSIILILFGSNLKAQSNQPTVYHTYEKKINIANKHDSIREYQLAEKYYDSAFLLIDYLFYDYFNAFQSAIKNSNYEKASHYLIQGSKKGLDISNYNSKEIDEFQKTQYAENYFSIKDSLLKIHYSEIDFSYYLKLEQLVNKDQSLRDGSNEMKYIDSLNFENLIELSKSKGFPTFKATGNGCNFAFLLLWHHRGSEYPNSDQWKRIIPFIQKEIDLENLDPNFLKPLDNFMLEK